MVPTSSLGGGKWQAAKQHTLDSDGLRQAAMWPTLGADYWPTFKNYNNPLKVISEGSMVEYHPVGSKGAPKTIIGKNILVFLGLKSLTPYPSPPCSGFYYAAGKTRWTRGRSLQTMFL